jgi:hybrid cluster-associated redox disulfide protein
MPQTINSKMTIGQILKKDPNALKVFERYGLACANCHLNTMETLEQGAKAHGLSEAEVQTLAKHLSEKGHLLHPYIT